MTADSRPLPPHLEQLLEEIAARHRRRRLLRGATRFGLAALALMLLLIVALALGDRFGLPRWPAISLAALGALAGAWHWLLLPLREPVPLRRIALWIDEHHPELENRIVSAVEFSERDPEGSRVLIDRFLGEVESMVPDLEPGELVDPRSLAWSARLAVGLWVAVAALILLTQQLWFPIAFSTANRVAAPAAAPAPPTFRVEPGNVRVRAGANQVVLVTSDASDPRRTLRWRQGEAAEWRTETMQPGAAGDVHYHHYLDLREDLQYQVAVGDQLSPLYTIDVWTPPEVRAIDITYNYPDYLDLPPRELSNAGDVEAVEGTRVAFNVEVNKPLERAALVLRGGERIELTEESPLHWGGTLDLANDDRYHVELLDAESEAAELDREYRITALPDRPPVVRIAFPRGDSEATAIEEIPIAFKVTDDFGLADFGLQYSLPGRDPVRFSLRGDADSSLTEAARDHLLMLEELELATGDLIVWNIWAEDRKPGRGEFDVAGDPYFLEIRPFRREYSEAISNMGGEQQAGQQGGGEGQGAADQKQVIIATWNLRRDGAGLTPAEFEKRREAIVEAQQALMEQPEGATRPGAGGLDSQSTAGAAEAMKQAVEALGQAALPQPAPSLSQALVHEQEAYRQLLRNQPAESQVMQARSQGGGQSGQRSNESELSQLEMDRRRDFRDEASTQNDTREQERDAEVLGGLEELAKRQRMLNEEMAKLLSEKERRPDETPEEMQRRLERLREEQRRNLAQLDQLAGEVASSGEERRQAQEQIQDARRQMDRSAENLDRDELQQARAAGSRALDSLGEAQSRYEQLSGAAAERRLAGLRENMQELRERQEQVVERTRELQEQSQRPGLDSGSATQEKIDEALAEKSEITKELAEVLEQAGELTEQTAQSQELMSRRLGDWLRDANREAIPDAIEQGRPLLQYGAWDAALAQEQSVAERLERAAVGLEGVEGAMVDSELAALQRALDEIDGLLGGSNGEREGEGEHRVADAGTSGTLASAGRDPAEQGEQGQQGQQGRQGRQGQQGQQAGESREGDQQGQSGQGEEQGRQGQAGQQAGEQGEGSQQGQAGQQGQGGQQGQAGQQGQGGQQGQTGQQGQGSQQGQAGQPGQQGPGGRSDAEGQRGASREGNPEDRRVAGGDDYGGARNGGDYDGNYDGDDDGRNDGGQYAGPRSDEEMRRFFDSDYRRWTEALRNAEALLPEENSARGRIFDSRTAIDAMRRGFLRNRTLPGPVLFTEQITTPLSGAAEELKREIARRLNAAEYNISADVEVPARYSDRVAQYFKALSEEVPPQ